MSDNLIKFDKVSKFYNNGPAALDAIDLNINYGEFVSIVGHSGAGKSTLIKMMLAELYPSEGSVYVDAEDIKHLSKADVTKLRRRVGTIFQNFRLIDSKTVYENIAFALEVAGMIDSEIEADVPHVLGLVDLLDKAEHFPRELSGGEQQRVAIARAIVIQPTVLVADEPTGNLDPINTFEVVQILKKINDLGTTVVLTTHNKGVIDSVGGRVITMDSGKIVRDDKEGQYML
ncbi:MAG: ATP-binding cassette domain-containing protein [Candidatus Pacebacteria bacterium]|nr:ATP-binding cassette domain-containing protein [Candidatus Paceibacterota bacterium]